MIEALLLGLLVLCDSLFAGFRAAAGRDPRLYKVDYYVRSVWTGALAGLLIIFLVSALLGLSLAMSSNADALFADYMRSSRHLLWVYGAYATIVLLAMGMWTYPSPDVRTLASVLVLGPFTLLRPYVVVTGCTLALVLATNWQVRGLCAVAVAIQLSLEPALNVIQAKAQRRRFGPKDS